MEMQQVRYFIAVARTLNFTRAAEECNVTQPALTRAIKLLEHELGGDLIRREGRLSHLTELGQRMLPMLRQCHDAALAAKSLARAVSKGEVSTLSIALSRSLDPAFIMSSLKEMYTAFPGLQIKLKRGAAAEIAAMLKSGEVELALGGPLGESWDRLEAWPMFSESFDLVVGADHRLAMRNAIDLDVELLRNERFLLHRGADLTNDEIDKLASVGIDIHQAHEVHSNCDLEAMVAGGFGIAVTPASSLRSDELQHFSHPALDLSRPVAVYAVSGRQRTREAAALLSQLRMRDWSAAV